jgi:type II secretory pathway component PulM
MCRDLREIELALQRLKAVAAQLEQSAQDLRAVERALAGGAGGEEVEVTPVAPRHTPSPRGIPYP